MYKNVRKIYGNVLKIYGNVWKCMEMHLNFGNVRKHIRKCMDMY